MPNAAHSADVFLYQRAVICKQFPGTYTLESAKHAPVGELMRALELISAATKIQS